MWISYVAYYVNPEPWPWRPGHASHGPVMVKFTGDLPVTRISTYSTGTLSPAPRAGPSDTHHYTAVSPAPPAPARRHGWLCRLGQRLPSPTRKLRSCCRRRRGASEAPLPRQRLPQQRPAGLTSSIPVSPDCSLLEIGAHHGDWPHHSKKKRDCGPVRAWGWDNHN